MRRYRVRYLPAQSARSGGNYLTDMMIYAYCGTGYNNAAAFLYEMGDSSSAGERRFWKLGDSTESALRNNCNLQRNLIMYEPGATVYAAIKRRL